MSGEYNTEYCFVQNFIFGKIQIEKYLILFSSKKPQLSHVGSTYKDDLKGTFSINVAYCFFFLLHLQFLYQCIYQAAMALKDEAFFLDLSLTENKI